MRLNWFLALCLLSILQTGSCRPRNKSQLLAGEPKSEVKKREIIKSDIDLLKELEKSGVGVKRNSKNNETPQESKISIIESAKSLSASKSSSFSKTDEDLKSTDLSEVESATRVKKQTPNNLCIKVSFFFFFKV